MIKRHQRKNKVLRSYQMILFRFNAIVDCGPRLIIVAEVEKLKPFTQGDNPLKLHGGDDDEGGWL